MSHAREPDAGALRAMRDAACARDYVSLGSRRTNTVHEFYRYPARFSPTFARAVIEAFSEPGDLVLDPFLGGGTTLVESRLTGRLGIGSDINALATFVSDAKTIMHSGSTLRAVEEWASELSRRLNVSRRDADWDSYWDNGGYLRHLGSADTWRIRNLIAQSLEDLDLLASPKSRKLARCGILRTAQWALDMRQEIPDAATFRDKLVVTLGQMVRVANEYKRGAAAMDRSVSANGLRRTVVLKQSLPGLADHPAIGRYPVPKLMLTSPPYPAVYVNYHRWKVRGRKETAAPFWVAGCPDGHGLAHYTMSARVSRTNLDAYFAHLEAAWRDLAQIVDEDTWIVQAVGFHHPEEQLPRYLAVMKRLGLKEVRFRALATHPDGRLWRNVPSRRWWVMTTNRDDAAPHTAHEVVLVHRVGGLR